LPDDDDPNAPRVADVLAEHRALIEAARACEPVAAESATLQVLRALATNAWGKEDVPLAPDVIIDLLDRLAAAESEANRT
jgi:hypothetical protein